MLNFMVALVVSLIHNVNKKLAKKLFFVMHAFLLFEIVVYLINPFKEIAISYTPRGTILAHFVYDMHPVYISHLIYTYSMVVIVLVTLFIRMLQVPSEYRRTYIYILVGIIAIVAQNAAFLFIPNKQLWNMMDYSVWGYSICGLIMYWSFFVYSKKGLLATFRNSVFENIDQAIILFDYANHMILSNSMAKKFFPEIDWNAEMSLQKFLRLTGLDIEHRKEDNAFSMQCYRKEVALGSSSEGEQSELLHPLRCDYSKMKNAKGELLGTLLVFADAEFETDLLTRFHESEHFRRLAATNPENFDNTKYVLMVDINSLSVINSTYGRSFGDQKIRELAALMRSILGNDCYFIRGHEARLIALIPHMEFEDIVSCVAKIEEKFDGKLQYDIEKNNKDEGDGKVSSVEVAILNALKGMQAKKLLDKESNHSALMTSLIKALQECDPDTEAHVKRTQVMGEKLGKRIGLSDMDMSNLALLCVLHDIGKVGVPLEILNKPGRLNDEEWQIIKSHADKGYQIAKSTPELSGIADMIRHHHERWDGEGYPDGLSKESIPMLSRIISVVDSYDAMISVRAYKDAMPKSKAIEELKRCSGTQFDPYIVSEFIKMLDAQGDVVEDEIVKEEAVSKEDSDKVNIHERAVHIVPYTRYILDDKWDIIEADGYFEAVTGYSIEDVKSRKISQLTLIPQDERMEYINEVNRQMARKQTIYLEHSILRKNGSIIYVFCIGRFYYDSAVRTERIEVIVSESSSTYSVKRLAEQEHKMAQKKLREWENTYRRDPLTGLFNHAAFQSDVELKLLKRHKKVMFLMLDVDNFKEYNDTYGHLKGDQFLILVANSLTSILRDEDLACRMGGDEFAAAIMFDDEVTDEEIYARARQIFDRITLTVKAEAEAGNGGGEGGSYSGDVGVVGSGNTDGHGVYVEAGAAGNGTTDVAKGHGVYVETEASSNMEYGVSVGVAIASDPLDTFNELYKAADTALYESKKNGRGRISYYMDKK